MLACFCLYCLQEIYGMLSHILMSCIHLTLIELEYKTLIILSSKLHIQIITFCNFEPNVYARNSNYIFDMLFETRLRVDTPASVRVCHHNIKSMKFRETCESQGYLFLLSIQLKSVFKFL